jgi:hypothetical protein
MSDGGIGNEQGSKNISITPQVEQRCCRLSAGRFVTLWMLPTRCCSCHKIHIWPCNFTCHMNSGSCFVSLFHSQILARLTEIHITLHTENTASGCWQFRTPPEIGRNSCGRQNRTPGCHRSLRYGQNRGRLDLAPVSCR